MSKIKFEPLANNDVKLPQYATENSACMDFGACLTRPCYSISSDDYARKPFVAYVYAGRPLRSYINEEDVNAFEMPGSCQKFYRKNLPPNWEKAALEIAPHETILIPLGFKSQFPSDYVMMLFIRSSLGLKGLQLANSVGIIDADYRGEIFAAVVNRSSVPVQICDGDRIAQATLIANTRPSAVTGTVNSTDRSDGGFGSTGE